MTEKRSKRSGSGRSAVARSGGRSLVIVESPTKARTISGFLPEGFVVEASIGHVRDLPNSAKEIPATIKDQPWARLGINIDNDFQPVYVVPPEKKKQISKLKALLKDAAVLYLATDEDREGESISWHLVQVLQPKVPLRRMVFHEITREAIKEALDNPRELDQRLVQAQETRRILDRLYGYEISPILWRKIGPGLSAGRVQSVAIRLIVEREEERRRFRISRYWDLLGRFGTQGGSEFSATLVSVGGRRVASGKDFDARTGALAAQAVSENVLCLDEAGSRSLAAELMRSSFTVRSVEKKPFVERPAPPFTTSTLQQEANRKMRMTARRTMQAAQRLYENGLITYMRTDSTTLSDQAIGSCRELIRRLYGDSFVAREARQYKTKVRNAQEAHEAIRPAADFQRPEEIRGRVDDDGFRLYELIWKRTVACQMADAFGHRTQVQVGDGRAVFQTSGKTIEFPGYLRAYVEGADDPLAELADKEVVLPVLESGRPLTVGGIEPRDHATQSPARFTEASLVKELEARGIGRPSTYATIIDTIQQREYVVRQGTSLVPTFTAFAVVKLLEKHFESLVDANFTARMEDELDQISLGEQESVPYLRRFYFGDNGVSGLKQLLQADIDPRAARTIAVGVDRNGQQIEVRIGRYGPYLQRGEDRSTLPNNLAPDELTVEKAEELLRQGSGPTELGVEAKTGRKIYAKVGRFGPYVQLGENDAEPKMKSLLPGMQLETLTLSQALELLSLPRELGVDPTTGEKVIADHGRFGPYVKRDRETRSLSGPDEVFSVTLDRALALLKEAKKSGRASTPTLMCELGVHPATGKPLRLMAGRYGPYVTDGEINASIPKGMNPDSATLEQAAEWLRARAERVASGEVRPRVRRRAAAGKKKARKAR